MHMWERNLVMFRNCWQGWCGTAQPVMWRAELGARSVFLLGKKKREIQRR